MSIYSVIEATGTYIPERVMNNSKFHRRIFYNPNGSVMDKSSKEIVDKFQEITDIESRRYVDDNLVNSEIATYAALNALATSRIDGETLDCIIVAHNFGDVSQSKGIVSFLTSITNDGESDLVIDGIVTSCMCTTANIIVDGEESPTFGMHAKPSSWKQVIKPGEEARLKINYDPNAHPELRGSVTRVITLSSNDPQYPKKDIKVYLNQVS